MSEAVQKRHERVGELYLEAARLAPELRRAFLESRCGDDPSILTEVEGLLSMGSGSSAGIRTGAIDVGAVFDAMPAATGTDALSSGAGTALSSEARYRILRVLGEGGMGTVYLAEQDRPRRTVALKVMRASISNAERLRKRFSLEAEVLGRLEHPGIARIYDAGMATVATPDGSLTVPYFAMEYVDGVALTEYVATHRLGTRARMALIARIAHALGAAHRLGIVHRDVKPQNVLVDARGQPKVLDFGVARATDAEVAVTTVRTDVGQLIGTLAYMSPEQVEGDPRKIDVRSDVYALGAVAFELLTGRALVDARGKTVAEVARIIRDEDPSRLSSIDRTFRGDLDTIVSKALEKDPARRYGDANELAADIDRYLADEPIVARPPTTLYQLSKFAKRNRALVAGVIVSFVLLVIGLLGTSIGFLRARDQAAIAERRFTELRTLANKFIYDVHDQIVDLPGSTAARKSIVETALAFLDGIAKERVDDEVLAKDLSEAYLKVGAAQGYGSRANLGDRAGARASFMKAYEIRRAWLDRRPTDVDTRRAYARVLNQIGNLDIAEKRFDDALARLGESLAIREAIMAERPDDAMSVREVAVSEQWIGNAHREVAADAERGGRTEDQRAALERALTSYSRYTQLMSRIAEADPKLRRDATVGYEKLGDALYDMKRLDEALTEYERSLEIRETLASEAPTSKEAQRDLNVALAKVGRAHMAAGNPEKAGDFLERTRDIFRAGVEADPNDVLAKTDLVVAETRLADLWLARFDSATKKGEIADPLFLDEADGAAKRAVDLLQALDQQGKLDDVRRSWIPEIEKVHEETQRRRGQT